MNILPKSNQFIEEIKEFHPETDLEQEGKRILTFKGTFDNLRKLRVEIEKIKDKYPIDKYVKIQYSGPVTKQINLGDKAAFVLDLDVNADEQDRENLINELLSNEEIINIISFDYTIVIVLKNIITFDMYKLVFKNIETVARKHDPESEGLIPFHEKGNYTVIEFTSLEVAINLLEVHKKRLEYYYHKDMTVEDEAESIKYLVNQGLSASDIGISRSKYFRNKPEIPVSPWNLLGF